MYVDQPLLNEGNKLALGEHHIGETQTVEFVLMRKQEEVVADHRQRALKQRREVFGVHLQQRKETLAFGAFERLRTTRGRPAAKDLTHGHFWFALTELVSGVERSAGKRQRAIVLAGSHVGEDSLGFFVLGRTKHRHNALERPVVERALVVKLERADRVGDIFERVFDRVREGVHRVDAPLIARGLVFSKTDAIDRRIAQVDVGRSHINLGAQHHGAFRMLTVAHFAEDAQVFLWAAVAIRRVLARFEKRAAIGAHFVGALFVDVGVTGLDQMFGKLVHPIEIIGRVIEIVFRAMLPVKAHPADAFLDRVNVLLVFLNRVGVVKAHVADALVIGRQSEIQANALGVTDMQIAVGFGRKTRANTRPIGLTLLQLFGIGSRMTAPVARQVVALLQIVFNDLADEVGRTRGARFDVGSFFISHLKESKPCAPKELGLSDKRRRKK